MNFINNNLKKKFFKVLTSFRVLAPLVSLAGLSDCNMI